jgi:uncharacterized membrane protein
VELSAQYPVIQNDYKGLGMSLKIHSFLVAVVLAAGLILPPNSSAGFGIFGQHKTVKAVDGEVRLPLDDVSDGKAHYYAYKSDGKEIKFFVVKSNDGVIRAAFDACDVCFPAKKGYSQDGDYMICNNCGRRFHSSQVNVVEGGCNPAPLHRETVGSELIIKEADILPGARFF